MPRSFEEAVISASSVHAERPTVAIVGAGIIGLSIGFRLALAGCRVDVFDRADAGRGATHAAAGMLAAGVEAEPGEQVLLPLCLASQAMWPEFAQELEASSGEQVDLRLDGTLVVALNRDDVEALRHRYDFQRSLGISIEWLSGAAAREREPHLHPRTAGAIFSAKDGQVDNRNVASALKTAFLRAGGHLHEHTPVAGIDIEAGRARGVVIAEKLHSADIVVLAAGAWSRMLSGLPSSAMPPVRPVKGQMIAVRMNPKEPLVRHVIWAPKSYLVPRFDGRLLIGATTEEKGFDASLTAGGVLALLEAAWRALPGIEELAIDEMWTGFRPGSRDDAPVLGPVPGIDGLLLATGHHRNGILLAPITAKAIADFVLIGKLDDRISKFGIDRFTKSRETS
ncbi:MAG: glycine oxidase ThiO [Polyangiaceae bacterium]|nr:glycine oxidase ThiO [Polyangiaceae bacterium]